MVSGTASDPVILFALRAGIWTTGLALCLLLMIVAMRCVLMLEENRRAQLSGVWRPVLVQSLEEVPEALPRLRRKDWAHVLEQWSEMQELVRGEAEERLNEVARRLELDAAARRLLRGREPIRQRLATAVLGQMRDRGAWEELLRCLGAPSASLSLAAAKALVQIDPPSAMPLLTPRILARSDWPAAEVATILDEAGPEVTGEALGDAALEATPADAARLIRFAGATRGVGALPMIRRIVAKTEDDEVLAAALYAFGMLGDPEDLDTVRGLLGHARWSVRVRAASALGRIGTPEDEERLIAALADPEWWVRYRAAQALARLPGMITARLAQIRRAQADEAVRALLAQVVAEERFPGGRWTS